MSALKTMAKRMVVHTVARTAPITWRWRKPGSLVVLMYHRVLPEGAPERQSEQPGMYVSPETLDLHVTELKRRFELVHLDDWLRRAKAGQALPRLACAITFDDGWRDNYDHALPVLQKHGAPATIFLVASYVGTTQRFWPNRLMDLIRTEFSQPDSIPFPAKLREIIDPVLARARQLGKIDSDMIDPIVQHALGFNESEVRELVEMSEEKNYEMKVERDTLNQEEIAELASSGLVRFGSHSATHYRLDESVSDEVLMAEIVQSRTTLQEICHQPIDLFCFPNGVSCPSAVSLASRHYLGALSTAIGWHTAGSDPYLIPRIPVHDDVSADRNSFLARLSAWM